MRVLLAIAALALAACSPLAVNTDETVGACEQDFAAAAAIDDTHDSVEDLDPAILKCVSLDEWGAANAANPAALDGVDPFEYLGNRCDFGDGLSSTRLCKALLAACGTQPYADTTYCLTH